MRIAAENAPNKHKRLFTIGLSFAANCSSPFIFAYVNKRSLVSIFPMTLSRFSHVKFKAGPDLEFTIFGGPKRFDFGFI